MMERPGGRAVGSIPVIISLMELGDSGESPHLYAGDGSAAEENLSHVQEKQSLQRAR